MRSLVIFIACLGPLSPPAEGGIGAFGEVGGSAPLPPARQNAERRAELSSEARARMRRAMTAVGLILVGDDRNEEPRPRGSGVLVRQDGVVVTNWHVVMRDNSDQPYKEIYFSLAPESGSAPQKSARYLLRIAEVDRRLDLVLLQVTFPAKPDGKAGNDKEGKEKTPALPVTFPAIEIGDSRAVELLDDLVIIGFPEKGGATATLSRGVVEGKDNAGDWIKTDTRLLHGNSGGAAVNAEGKLIGIATKVEVDRASNDITLGTIGYLRPSHLVAQLLERWRANDQRAATAADADRRASSDVSPPTRPAPTVAPTGVTVRGVVKFAQDGKPVAGARVGLILAGREVAPQTLVSWGGTNAEGFFQLEKPVSPGRYTLRAKVVGDERYAVYNQEIEIKLEPASLLIVLQPAKKQ
jgi:S1-C subfamily serine protease